MWTLIDDCSTGHVRTGGGCDPFTGPVPGVACMGFSTAVQVGVKPTDHVDGDRYRIDVFDVDSGAKAHDEHTATYVPPTDGCGCVRYQLD